MSDEIARASLDDGAPPIGHRLRTARQGAGLTVRQTARALGVSPATWSAIENGRTRVTPQRIAAAAHLFGASFDGGQRDLPQEERDWRRYEPLELDPSLKGALAAFVEIGYHGATIRDIADRAGLSVPGIYHHYSTKQDLLRELHELTMTDLLWRAHAARDEGRDARHRFSNLIECLVLYHTNRQELSFIGASETRSLHPESLARIVRFRQEIQHMVDETVIDGCRSGSMATAVPKEASRAAVTMCTGVARWWSPVGPSSPAVVAAQYVGFALGIVGAVPRRGAGSRGGRLREASAM